MIASITDEPAPHFAVIDLGTACWRHSSSCQIGMNGFRDGRELLAWDTLPDPCDEFRAGSTRFLSAWTSRRKDGRRT